MKGAALKETEARLKDTQQKLESYEKIEKELDDIVLQSAQGVFVQLDWGKYDSHEVVIHCSHEGL